MLSVGCVEIMCSKSIQEQEFALTIATHFRFAYVPSVQKVTGIVDVAELVGEKQYLKQVGATKRNKHLGEVGTLYCTTVEAM